MQFIFRIITIMILAASLTGCGYNTIQRRDEQVAASWSQVLSLYKKRQDLVPNLVAIVQGYARHEKEVFTGVAEARASVGSMQVSAESFNDEQAVKTFMERQQALGGALSRLLVVAENYPQLKADAGFLDLQRQLKGVEDQLNAARGRFIREVRDYNIVIRSFPTNLTAMMFGYKTKPNFALDDEKAAATVPEINFAK